MNGPVPEVAKLIVGGCSKGNPGMVASGGILQDHRCVVLVAFGSFLGYQPILYTEFILFVRCWSLVLSMVALCLR